MSTTLDPRLLTSTVSDLARTIYDGRRFDLLPILADALMDAGCDDARLLADLRDTTRITEDAADALVRLAGVTIREVRAYDARRSGRKTRIVSDSILRETALAAAVSKAGRSWKCRIGGTVANAYKYPASTDAVVCVALCIGREIVVVMWATEIAANKATHGGAMAACVGGACRALCDARYGADATAAARDALYAAAREEAGAEVEAVA